jgi:hypothetical protein
MTLLLLARFFLLASIAIVVACYVLAEIKDLD